MERTIHITDAVDLATADTYAGLQHAYEHFNRGLFDGVLPGALITLQREGKTLGYFSAGRFAAFADHARTVDEIAMNPAYFGVRSIPETLSTLVHECVHQWQQHFGKPGRGRYHNREWADRMEAIGLLPTDTGKAGGKKTGDRMTHIIMPGGRFDVLCAELLNTEYRLAWFDRFPPAGYSLPGGSADEGEDTPAAPVVEPKTRNKIKYTCSLCGANAWGKPNLRLLCGGESCDANQFEPVDAD